MSFSRDCVASLGEAGLAAVAGDVCGCRFELVSSLTPARHHRLLTHIRRSTERQKRRKEEVDEEESEAEEEKEKRGAGMGSWLKESSCGDDPVDFLDSSLARRVSSEWSSLRLPSPSPPPSPPQPHTLSKRGLRLASPSPPQPRASCSSLTKPLSQVRLRHFLHSLTTHLP